jgi:site-specific recombinase XerD
MRLFDRMESVAARRHFSRHTTDCYGRWVRQFLEFCREGSRWRHPSELGGADVSRFLTHLAAERRVARSTQTQAMNGILFLYRDVLVDELGADHLGPIGGLRAGRRARVPTVLSVDEVRRVIGAVKEGSVHRLMVETLYGTGLRLASPLDRLGA